MMKRNVLGAVWYSLWSETEKIIGIVKVEDFGEVKYYIGFGKGDDEDQDIQMVLYNGSRFYPEIFGEDTP